MAATSIGFVPAFRLLGCTDALIPSAAIRLLVSVLVGSISFTSAATTTDECKQSYALAEKAKANFDNDLRLTHLSRAAEECPSFALLIEVGELRDEMNQIDDAGQAFSEAIGLAQTNAELAVGEARWAELAYKAHNNPQLAWPKIVIAKQLAPSDPKIDSLYVQIKQRYEHPEDGDIARGWLEKVMPEPQPNRLIAELTGVRGGAGGSTPPPPPPSIPIYFQFNSTMLDQESIPNLERLLKDMKARGGKSRFRFVGHSDARGDEYGNFVLSQRRAQEIERYVVSLAPEFAGRIDVEGRGEQQPFFKNAATEEQHRLNRRLEVVLED